MNKKQKPSTSLPWETIKLPGYYGVVNEQDLRACESQDSKDAAATLAEMMERAPAWMPRA